jgi:hypothetical protein
VIWFGHLYPIHQFEIGSLGKPIIHGIPEGGLKQYAINIILTLPIHVDENISAPG